MKYKMRPSSGRLMGDTLQYYIYIYIYSAS